MSGIRFLHALLSVLGISSGQLLLKIAATHLQNGTGWEMEVVGFRFNLWLIAGVTVLGLSTLVWLSVLRTVPLSYAYPVMALAFIIVPALSFLLLSEPLSLKLALGSLLIMVGLAVIYV